MRMNAAREKFILFECVLFDWNCFIFGGGGGGVHAYVDR